MNILLDSENHTCPTPLILASTKQTIIRCDKSMRKLLNPIFTGAILLIITRIPNNSNLSECFGTKIKLNCLLMSWKQLVTSIGNLVNKGFNILPDKGNMSKWPITYKYTSGCLSVGISGLRCTGPQTLLWNRLECMSVQGGHTPDICGQVWSICGWVGPRVCMCMGMVVHGQLRLGWN